MASFEGVWGTGLWGTDPYGAEQAPVAVTVAKELLSAENLSRDLVKLTFSDYVSITPTLLNKIKYTITGANGVDVVQVKAFSAVNKIYITKVVYLIVTDLKPGVTYTVTVSSDIKTYRDASLTSRAKQFKCRLTKLDSIISTRPSLYNLSPTSIIRNILDAMAQSDDKIGGRHG